MVVLMVIYHGRNEESKRINLKQIRADRCRSICWCIALIEATVKLPIHHFHPGWLFYIWDYPTSCYEICIRYNKPWYKKMIPFIFNQPASKKKTECHVHQVGFSRKPLPQPQLRRQKLTTRENPKAHIEETSPSEFCKKVRSVEDFQLISSAGRIKTTPTPS